MPNSKQYQYAWSEYDTLDGALKEATKRAQREMEDQVVYQAVKVVKPAASTLPTTEVVDWTASS